VSVPRFPQRQAAVTSVIRTAAGLPENQDGEVAGCADDGGAGGGEAVEAREQNEVRLGGVECRVPTFRQLNPRIEPDDTFYDEPPPGEGSGVYAAFILEPPAGEQQGQR
jgi:hypothetical protein